MKFGKLELYIDLGAEQAIKAEQNEQKIAIEIKSFLGQSAVTEFHRAVGQFIIETAITVRTHRIRRDVPVECLQRVCLF